MKPSASWWSYKSPVVKLAKEMLKDTEKKDFYILKKTYDILIVLLAIVSITLVFLDLLNKIYIPTNPYFFVDTSILIIFTIESSQNVGFFYI